jgi:hypothetical protein
MATFKSEHVGPVTAARQGESQFIADRNIYLDANGKVVEEDDPAQVRQLVGKGGTLSPADVEKYGLGKKSKAKAAETVEETPEEPEGGEKASSPPANKAEKPAANKARTKRSKK